jgi:hypothetical protein
MMMMVFCDQQGVDYIAFCYRTKDYDEQNSREIALSL